VEHPSGSIIADNAYGHNMQQYCADRAMRLLRIRLATNTRIVAAITDSCRDWKEVSSALEQRERERERELYQCDYS